ncbi:aspartate-semialdehyde dehydrogenase [Pseudomonas citronellolis]|uniref:aspartate-semialdehyde dehydrogenase n=1 Tax=Pseudomonas citronellolis TaxID=53408 RepID=UPI0023E453EC|nr:aspartate-semialdehyde dehydrogenase [Pseudomonas citronellolis]MDF3931752.1 aspartate-semialdehyde dehydrogenase [Pseudomonas citronellolis]
MIPPIPSDVLPVTAQQDPARVRPDVPPVAPVAPAAGEAAVSLERRPAELTPEEEYEQRRRRRQARGEGEPEEIAEDEADDGLGEAPRKGMWIDVEV